MPNREDETWLNIHPHPPACTCTECSKQRLSRLEKQRYTDGLECPKCGYQSLIYDGKRQRYECINPNCGVKGETLTAISKL